MKSRLNKVVHATKTWGATMSVDKEKVPTLILELTLLQHNGSSVVGAVNKLSEIAVSSAMMVAMMTTDADAADAADAAEDNHHDDEERR